MVQCLLGKNSRYQVAWIREKKAFVGNIVELIDDDRHDPGWRVISAGNRLSEEYLRERSRDYLRTRKASDI
jgi:hypothetical protein